VVTVPEHATATVIAQIDPDQIVHTPTRDADLLAALDAAIATATIRAVAAEARPPVPKLLGSSPAMRQVLDLVARLADAPATLLITGESGTGKSLLAREIHRSSRRRGKRFVEVACGCLSETLLESELFGHVAGAFTGATTDRILDDELVRGFISSVMLEAKAIGECIGIPIAQNPEDRHAVTRKLGAFRTSMLQDVQAGKPVELDALVSAVRELGELTQVPTPFIDALLGLSRLHARGLGLYPAQ
jgi:predicted ATPase